MLFGYGTVWPELLNESSEKLQTKRYREWKMNFVINKVAKTINHSATNCLAQSNVQILSNYTRSI
jgi:hypothetical protein